MHLASVFFADTVDGEGSANLYDTSIVLASTCDGRETTQASSAYSLLQTACRTYSIVGSGPIDVGGSSRCTSSTRMAISSMHFWRTTVSTAANKMLNNSGDSKHPYRSPCSTSNQSEQMPSSGRAQTLIPSWNCSMTAIICGGTPMQMSTCHRKVRSAVSYAFWRSMEHMSRNTPAFRLISYSLHTTNIMSSVVERSGRNPHCSSGNSPFVSQ